MTVFYSDKISTFTGTGSKTEQAVLANLPANVWTPFPNFPTITSIQNWEVFSSTGENLDDAFEYRNNGGTLEVFSLTAETNIQFNISGT